eukprot:TRINITY_DN61_c0_g2_i1.p1 TRINITY_DN61_c0_g2~~TRINITY_DN61_c0_g2_i1.p1  ORF type:complete len:116 (+),score=12.31 TRINITY_DN61_c0_g2_i1:120-467(+)
MADFKDGLFSCTQNITECLKGCFCLCCLISDNSAKLDGGEQCLMCCYPGNPIKNRFQCKQKYNMQVSCVSDCLVACCCGPCSECQIARQIDRVNTESGKAWEKEYAAPNSQVMTA